MYGGLEPEVTNVVFVYGQHDPWSIIGRTTDLNVNATAIVIPGKKIMSAATTYLKQILFPGATMGNDLGPITDADSDALVAAKLQISEIILQWIDEGRR